MTIQCYHCHVKYNSLVNIEDTIGVNKNSIKDNSINITIIILFILPKLNSKEIFLNVIMTRAEDQDEVVYKPTTESELFQKLKPQNEKKKDTCLFLYFTSIVVNLLPLTTGMAVTWTSPVSLKLLSSDPIINPLGKPVTTLQLSFIGSFPSLGAISGLMLLGSCFDIYGRKKIMIALSSLLAVSYIILAFSTNIYFYYASMVAIGLALGVGTAGTTLYCSEITEDHNRSKFICFIGLSLPLGNLLAFVLGPFFSVKVFSLMCSIPSFIYFFCFSIILPESPVYLLSKGDVENAKKALTELRNKSLKEIEKEIEMIQFTLMQNMKSEEKGLVYLVKNRASRKAFIIAAVMFSFSLTGAPSIIAFLDLIFQEAGTNISGFVSTITVALVQVIGCIVASMIVEKFGRRQLMLISSILCGIPMFAISLFFKMKSYNPSITESLGWLPVLSLVIFFIFFVIGLGNVPMVFVSEVFPNNVKSLATSIVISTNFIVIGLTLFLFPVIMANFGLAWNFFGIGGMCILNFVFIYCAMPETRGKSILEIQDILNV
ncbi:probable metabolite transport protein CsbC [Leptinotarsa decemlineata]|uniref:probable metabolite transport protein CsbC n=1 Tax=Leptinotarsa decemlineata TaxID=7539 RepID=UPI003D304D0F